MAAAAPTLTRDVAGLAVLLGTSVVLHLVRPQVFEGIVPNALPNRRDLVYVCGVVELLCAAGLLLRATFAATVARLPLELPMTRTALRAAGR